MDKKALASKRHFENTRVYLDKDFDIQIRCELIAEQLKFAQELELLDLGCGNGALSLQFQAQAKKLTLVDITENMLVEAKKNVIKDHQHKISFIQSDIDSFNSEDKFDVVICSGILAHVPSVNSAIQKIHSCLKPNGLCFVQITDSDQFLSKINSIYNYFLDVVFKNFRYKKNIFTLQEILGKFEEQQFQFKDKTQYSLVLPLMKSIFSNQTLYRYSKYVLAHRFLSNHGSDFMLTFRKK